MLISFDLGATNLRIAVIKDDQIVKNIKEPTAATKNSLLKQIIKLINELGVLPVAIVGSVCGPVNNAGDVIALPQLKIGYFPLAKELEATFNCPVKLVNDANAACLYYAIKGQGKNWSSVLYVTLSSGIGAGLVIDKKIYAGANGNALEIGKMSFYDDELEQNCSGVGLKERGIDPIDFFQNEEQVNRWIKTLANHLANSIFIIDPNILLLGGGLMKSASFFLSKLKKEISERLNKDYQYNLVIEEAANFDDAGLFGAALLLDK